MIQRFRKKPVVIEAVRYDGTNAAEIVAFAAPSAIFNVTLHIVTLEGGMLVSIGDWVIKGIKGSSTLASPMCLKQHTRLNRQGFLDSMYHHSRRMNDYL